jgi:hypothetical protein
VNLKKNIFQNLFTRSFLTNLEGFGVHDDLHLYIYRKIKNRTKVISTFINALKYSKIIDL